MSCARTFEIGSPPLIHLSISTLHPVLITRVPQRGAPKGVRPKIGKNLAPCYGFTENVHIQSLSRLFPANDSWIDSWLWEEYSQVRYYLLTSIDPIELIQLTSSVIIRDIKTVSNAGSAFLAYFYFDFKDTEKQDSHALLSSLLIQLSEQSDLFFDVLFSLYSAHKDGSEKPTDDSLAECLKDMLAITEQVPIYLVMDALDECPNDLGIPTSREKVLEFMKELVELRYPNLRLCTTSRPEFDIRATLEPLATQQVSLHNESGQKQDIVNYVTSVVHSDKKMKRWRENDKNMVVEKLSEKADGM